jgi:superfamily II DNA or RNA helicase
MELKETKEMVAEILSNIEKNKNGLTYRKYETFFGKLKMLKRRNLVILSEFDDLFKSNNITLWCGKEPVRKISEFYKGETITFRLESNNIDNDNNMQQTTKIKHAGTIHIADGESSIDLYPHQKEAFSNLQKEIIKSNKNPFAGLLVLPTGGGKTLTAAYWISQNILDKGKKVLWVAHRHELLKQAKATFAEKLAYKDIFKNIKSFNYRILSGIHGNPVNVKSTDNLIISSKDSLNSGFNYLQKNWLKKDDEIFLVIDEAHHATAKTYRKLINNLKDNVSIFRLLGLTATPFRTAEDETGLLKKVFPDDIIYKIDLRTLITWGILSEPIFEEVSTGQNYKLTPEQINELNSKFGDIDTILGKDIADTIANNSERNYAIVNRYVSQKSKYKQTIVFALNVANAIALNKLFGEKGVKSDIVVSDIKDEATGVNRSSKDNPDIIDRFRKGELNVLINVNILTEGTDVPNVQSIFLTRPTISNILVTQMIGRGLRGPKADGTKEAYIVNFIDDWHDKIAWVNPEQLFIEENVDFNDKDSETTKRLLRLVAINKIEEFAMLANQIIEPEKRKELEKLDFIQRIPKGIYQFRYLKEIDDDNSVEQHGEILVYNNIEQSYKDLLNTIPDFFKNNKLNRKESLKDDELKDYAQQLESEFFIGTEQYPAYRIEDIKDLLQYYSIQEELPVFIPLSDREKYDVDKIAQEIFEKDLGPHAEKKFVNEIWSKSENAWQTFFNYNQSYFIREISVAKERIAHPKLFERKIIKPIEEYESRKYENMSLSELREVNPQYEKCLRDKVFEKFTDKDGYYYSAESDFRSKNRLSFQIDHIKPMSKGGLTVFDNLQLLTRRENAIKGSR